MEIKSIEDFFDEENTGKGWEYTHSGIDVMPTDFVKEVAKKYAEQFIDLAADRVWGISLSADKFYNKNEILKLKELIK